DAVRTATQNDDLLALADGAFALRLVGRVQVRGVRGELGRAGVHASVDGPDAARRAQRPNLVLALTPQFRELRVAEPEPLALPQELVVELGGPAHSVLVPDDAHHLPNPPR